MKLTSKWFCFEEEPGSKWEEDEESLMNRRLIPKENDFEDLEMYYIKKV
jgi:hypothetical protein